MRFMLKEALKALCGDNQWTYGVFWKIGCKNPKVLIWEEHYYSPTTTSNCGLPLKSETLFQECDASPHSLINSSADKIHLLLTKMMVDDVHIVGEGLVGQVALTGKHNWICSEKFNVEAHHPKVVRKIYQQFSAGLQTVAVVPVLPHGVVQFASHFQIVENMGFVNNVAMLLLRLVHIPGVFHSEDYVNQELAPRISIPIFTQLESNSSVLVNSSQFIAEEMSNGISSSFRSFNSSQFMAEGEVIAMNSDFDSQRVVKDLSSTSTSTWNHKCNEICASEDPNIALSSSLLHCSTGMNRKIEMKGCKANDTTTDDMCGYDRASDDLFDVLGAEFRNQVLMSLWDNEIGVASPEICPMSREGIESKISPQRQGDYLLEAVISNPQSAKHPDASLNDGEIRFRDLGKEESLEIPKHFESSSEKKSSVSISGIHDSGTSLIYDSWMAKGLNMKRNNEVSGGVCNKPNHKKLKPVENPRPRPRDRQMIQDRVKELREIVPNGAKCSIDSLLERTIKHMLFLQSVTKHADKLNQSMESKSFDDESDLRGASYDACEVGLQSKICPISVEELNQPGHMLIEMVCQQEGFFLEIADIIRSLGLTILRGIIETRKDDIWARFSVETNRDITRMEVSLTLVSFIKQNTQRNSVKDEMV